MKWISLLSWFYIMETGRYKRDQVIFPKSHSWLVVEPGLRPVSCDHKLNMLLSFVKMYLPPCSLDFSFCLWIPYRDRRDNSDNSFSLVMVSAVAQEGNVKLWTLCSKEKGRKCEFSLFFHPTELPGSAFRVLCFRLGKLHFVINSNIDFQNEKSKKLICPLL